VPGLSQQLISVSLRRELSRKRHPAVGELDPHTVAEDRVWLVGLPGKNRVEPRVD
jgi:hypothetical protein